MLSEKELSELKDLWYEYGPNDFGGMCENGRGSCGCKGY